MSQGVPTPIPNPKFRKPTKCNQSIIDTVCARLRKGGYPTVALEAEGLDGTNHHEWLTRASEDMEAGLTSESSIYIQYSQAVKAAVAERELSLAARVAEAAEAGPQYWAAGATYLERRHPDRWGRVERIKQEGGAPVIEIRVLEYHAPPGVSLSPGQPSQPALPSPPSE